eukprot:Amastigsp_a344001_9.p3 type:complete len:261 gc:universal Amastigsp_a344001_9:850-68(-)
MVRRSVRTSADDARTSSCAALRFLSAKSSAVVPACTETMTPAAFICATVLSTSPASRLERRIPNGERKYEHENCARGNRDGSIVTADATTSMLLSGAVSAETRSSKKRFVIVTGTKFAPMSAPYCADMCTRMPSRRSFSKPMTLCVVAFLHKNGQKSMVEPTVSTRLSITRARAPRAMGFGHCVKGSVTFDENPHVQYSGSASSDATVGTHRCTSASYSPDMTIRSIPALRAAARSVFPVSRGAANATASASASARTARV